MWKAHAGPHDDIGYDLAALAEMSASDFEVALSAVWERDWGVTWRTIEVLEIAAHRPIFRDRAMSMLETVYETEGGDIQLLAQQAIDRLCRLSR